mmetsp:Transcript_96335/g.241529  ORF Transcript_96335/g.241529 Transcript_96335/m.241529 type:complete len:207 (+) Transcript_96335:503-1123(+)
MRDRLPEDANRPNHLAHDFGLGLACIGRVADDHLALGNLLFAVLVMALHTADLARVVVHEAVDGLIEHVGASMDCGQTGETLWQPSEAVDRVEEGRAAVLHHRVQVQLALVDCGPAGLPEVVVIDLQGDCVSDEVNRGFLQPEFAVDLRHGVALWVNSLVRFILVILPTHDELSEVDEAGLLQDAHERRLQAVLRRSWDLMNVLGR